MNITHSGIEEKRNRYVSLFQHQFGLKTFTEASFRVIVHGSTIRYLRSTYWIKSSMYTNDQLLVTENWD